MSAAPERLRERSERTRRCPPQQSFRRRDACRRRTELAETLPEPALFTGTCRLHRNLRTHAMAALQEVTFSKINLDSLNNQDWIRDTISAFFWQWYERNLDLKVTTIQFWIIKKNIYVRDLRSIFELLFGQQPNGTTT